MPPPPPPDGVDPRIWAKFWELWSPEQQQAYLESGTKPTFEDNDTWGEDVLTVGTGGIYGQVEDGDYLGAVADPLGIFETGGEMIEDVASGGGPEFTLDPNSPEGKAAAANLTPEQAAQQRLLDQMQRAADEYQAYRPEVQNARMNAMRQQSQAFQPANDALATMYAGQSFNPGTMFDNPFDPTGGPPPAQPAPAPQAPPMSQAPMMPTPPRRPRQPGEDIFS